MARCSTHRMATTGEPPCQCFMRLAGRLFVMRVKAVRPAKKPYTERVRLTLRLRTGDFAILVGAAAIAAYEVVVRDDEDLISRRVAAYRTTRHGRVLADAIILATALHLSQQVPDDLDIYCWLMRWVRKASEQADTLIKDAAA